MKKCDFDGLLLDCLGCKWTHYLMRKLAEGVRRPGQLVKASDGLSAKVFNETMQRMLWYGITNKHDYAEIPPRVEYGLTDIGEQLLGILNQLRVLRDQYNAPV